jgi:hypothetical protein
MHTDAPRCADRSSAMGLLFRRLKKLAQDRPRKSAVLSLCASLFIGGFMPLADLPDRTAILSSPSGYSYSNQARPGRVGCAILAKRQSPPGYRLW